MLNLFTRNRNNLAPIICIYGQSNAVGSLTGTPADINLLTSINNNIYYNDIWYNPIKFPYNNFSRLDVDHGSELAIGYYSKKQIYINKVALGWTSIREGITSPSWDINEVGGLYEQAINTLLVSNKALKNIGLQPYLLGIYWNQGETDANYSGYYDDLSEWITTYRNDVSEVEGADVAKFIIGGISVNSNYYTTNLRNAQESIANNIAYTHFLNTDNNIIFSLGGDSVHFDSNGNTNIGKEILKIFNLII